MTEQSGWYLVVGFDGSLAATLAAWQETVARAGYLPAGAFIPHLPLGYLAKPPGRHQLLSAKNTAWPACQIGAINQTAGLIWASLNPSPSDFAATIRSQFDYSVAPPWPFVDGIILCLPGKLWQLKLPETKLPPLAAVGTTIRSVRLQLWQIGCRQPAEWHWRHVQEHRVVKSA